MIGPVLLSLMYAFGRIRMTGLENCVLGVCFSVGMAASASGAVIDLTTGGTGASLDEVNAGDLNFTTAVLEEPFATAGVTVTVTAFVGLAAPSPSTPDDVNANGTSLGINSGTGAPSGESASEFDPGESLSFLFNTDLLVSEVGFTSVTGSDAGTLQIGATSYGLTAGSTDSGSDWVFGSPLLVTAGTLFTVTGGTGTFGLEFIDAVIPEPASLVLVGLGSLSMLARRRRA